MPSEPNLLWTCYALSLEPRHFSKDTKPENGYMYHFARVFQLQRLDTSSAHGSNPLSRLCSFDSQVWLIVLFLLGLF